MNKLIIDNRPDLTDYNALEMVMKVVNDGRICGTEGKEQYCYLSTFTSIALSGKKRKFAVSTDLNKKTIDL